MINAMDIVTIISTCAGIRCVYIQNFIKEYENNKVLIIDDYVASGNFLYAFTERLTKKLEFKDYNIRTICIAASTKNKTLPNYYFTEVVAGDCYFPWGEAK